MNDSLREIGPWLVGSVALAVLLLTPREIAQGLLRAGSGDLRARNSGVAAPGIAVREVALNGDSGACVRNRVVLRWSGRAGEIRPAAE